MIYHKSQKRGGAKRNPLFLLNVIFFFSLLLLVVNDHIWKATYGNVLTGKISDFAGLVLLPLYLAYLFPRLVQRAIGVSIVIFLFWKSPLVTPLIEYYNLFTPIPISRVVDYTDYLAFAILPLPWWMINNPQKLARFRLPTQQYTWALVFLVATSMSFVATSPPYWYRYSVKTGNVHFYKSPYTVKKSPQTILTFLEEEGISYQYYYRNDTLLLARDHSPGDSLQDAAFNSFVIPQLVVEEDTFYDVNFSLFKQGPAKTGILLSSMNVPGASSAEIDAKMKKAYLRLLKKEIVRTVRKKRN